MERVLAVEAAEKRDDGLVQHVAVEDVFHETGAEVDDEEGSDEGEGGGADLGPPDGGGGEQPKQTDEGGQRDGDGDQEQREGEFLLHLPRRDFRIGHGVFLRGIASDGNGRYGGRRENFLNAAAMKHQGTKGPRD